METIINFNQYHMELTCRNFKGGLKIVTSYELKYELSQYKYGNNIH